MNRIILRYKLTTNISRHATNATVKPFENLDSTSVSTMEKILTILSNATEVSSNRYGEKKEYNDINNSQALKVLGHEVFDYRIIRFLNSQQVVSRDPRLWDDSVNKYKEFLLEASNDKRPDFLTIGNLFLNDIKSNSVLLNKEIRSLFNQEFPIIKYNFPQVKIPSALRPHTSNRFILNKNPGMNKFELNLFSYIIDNEELVRRFIQSYQRAQGVPVTPYELIHSLIQVQSFEGEKLFTILVKRLLSKHNYLNTEFIINKFLVNNNDVKTIICYQSKIISRLFGLNYYRHIMKSIDVEGLNKENVMITNFNNFLATCYRQDQMHVENWLYGLMKFYLDTNYDDTSLYGEAFEYLDEIFSEEYPIIN